MATKKEKIRAWLFRHHENIVELSQRIGVVRDALDENWIVRRSDGSWTHVENDDFLNPDLRRLVLARNYYLGGLDICQSCGIDF